MNDLVKTTDSQKTINRTPPWPCGKSNMANLERRPRGFFLKAFLFWLPLKKYYCYQCMHNRYIF